jgi:hypothetical protein
MSLHTRLVLRLLALAICAAAAGSAARAADNTRYVRITGDNANACTLAAPCRTLQRGINVTPAGGELRILDSGVSANNATVSKSITISGNGNTLFLGTGITIDDAAAVVTLRDLTLNGQGTTDDGISVVAAAAVHIERCLIHNFPRYGIHSLASGVEVFVSDSVSRDNGVYGLFITSTSAPRLTVDNSHFDSNGSDGISIRSGYATISSSSVSGNNIGILATQGAFVSVVSTIATKNSNSGFGATIGGIITVESSVAIGNSNGLTASNGGIARISKSSFTDNSFGIVNSSTIETRQNNTVEGNGTDLQGNALTTIGGI